MSGQGPAQELVGAVLNGQWRLVRLLGEGGMGAVFEADGPPGVGKRAIKLLHQEYVKEDLILARFFAESQATRGLNHPNVVQVLETGTAENGTPYLVMELLQGVPVADYVDAAQALPTAQAVHIVHGVLQALGAAHARGIIHRDVKPDNIFLVSEPNGSFHAKVLDFGIAKVMDVAGGMGQKTRTGVLLGTPGYMSPEQIKNSKGVDARADLWSVGIIFYELLTGASPFPADNEFARLTSVLTEEVKPIDQVMPHLAPWTGFFVRALSKDPARRFQTAEEMAATLLNIARSPSLRPPAQAAAPNPAASPAQPSPAAALGIQTTQAAQMTPDWRAGSANAYSPTTPGPVGIQQTAAMPMMEYNSSSSLASSASPSMVATAPLAAPGYPPQQAGLVPTVTTPVREASGLIASPALAATATAPVRGQPAPPSMLMGSQHVAAVSQGSIPPPRPAAYSAPPPSDLAGQYGAGVVNVGPTHVSAQHPQGAPLAQGYQPSVQVIEAPLRPVGMAPYWVVGVVAFVAFGLGLAIGLAVG